MSIAKCGAKDMPNRYNRFGTPFVSRQLTVPASPLIVALLVDSDAPVVLQLKNDV